MITRHGTKIKRSQTLHVLGKKTFFSNIPIYFWFWVIRTRLVPKATLTNPPKNFVSN